MSVLINVPALGYSTLVPIISHLPAGTVYYYNPNAPPAKWSICFIASDGSAALQMIGAATGFPSTFSTDFPSAIQLTADPGTITV